MIRTRKCGPVLNAVAVMLGAWLLSSPSVMGFDDGPELVGQNAPKRALGHKKARRASLGTLGYGPPGLHDGFPGFGLGYHPGYGYGGDALGTGAEGGYPFYGGPGYPHPSPALRRFGPITPFPHLGGLDYPCADRPNAFGVVGPLVADQDVIAIEDDPRDPVSFGGYGVFSGSLPYPETTFAPIVADPRDRGTPGGTGPASPALPPSAAPTRDVPDASAACRALGILAETIVDSDSVRALKITKVDPGSAADSAGLRAGDVLRSSNGYRTERPVNLAWIIANASPDHSLKLSVRSAKDGEIRTVSTRLH